MDPQLIGILQSVAAMDPEIQAWLRGGPPPQGAQAQMLINNALAQVGKPPIPFGTPAAAQALAAVGPAASNPTAAPVGGVVGGGRDERMTADQIGGYQGQVATPGNVSGGISSAQDNGIGGGGPQGAAAQAAIQQQRLGSSTVNEAANRVAAAAVPAAPPATGGGAAAPGGLSTDPSSITGGTLYRESQAGDSNALDLLLVQTLQNLGVDPFSGSDAVKSIASAVAPYLKLVMEYSGLGDVAGDKGKQYADNFQHMISSPNSFQQIRGWAADTMGKVGSLGAGLKTPQQLDLVNDLLTAQTAGGNVITNSALRNRAQQNETRFRLASMNDPRVSNYFNWLKSDPTAQADPMYSQLRSVFGG